MGQRKPLDSTYALYMVKRHEEDHIRLISFYDVMHYAFTHEGGFKQIVLYKSARERYDSPLLEKNRIVWFSPLNPIFWEATQDDEQAKKEYQKGLKVIDEIKDLTPENMEEGDTLLKCTDKDDVYQVVDGNWRLIN